MTRNYKLIKYYDINDEKDREEFKSKIKWLVSMEINFEVKFGKKYAKIIRKGSV